MSDAAGDFAPRAWSATAEYYIAEGVDIRDVIEAFGLNYNRGAVVKYLARAGRKPGNGALLDLLKAREHLNREIARLERRVAGDDPVCPHHPNATLPRDADSARYCAMRGCGWAWRRDPEARP